MKIPTRSATICALAAALALPTVSSCGFTVGSGGPGELSVTTTSSSTSDAAAAPAMATASATAVPGPKTLGPYGYGALRLGMTEKQAIATGEITTTCDAPGKTGCFGLPDPGGYVCVSKTIGVAVVDAGQIHTDRGVGVGSTRAQVVAAYPTLRLGSHGLRDADATPNGDAFYSFSFDSATDRVDDLVLRYNYPIASKSSDCFNNGELE